MRFAVAIVSPPDHHDISGGAFNEVAEALHHGLVALGHDSVLTNRLDLDERRTIVLGGNLLVQYALEPPRNPIFYNLEQLGDDLPWMTMPEFVDLFRRLPALGLQSSQRRVPRCPGTAPAHLRSDRIRPRADTDRPSPRGHRRTVLRRAQRAPIRRSQGPARPRSSCQMAIGRLRREPRCLDRTLEDRPQHPLLGSENLRNHACFLSARQ